MHPGKLSRLNANLSQIEDNMQLQPGSFTYFSSHDTRLLGVATAPAAASTYCQRDHKKYDAICLHSGMHLRPCFNDGTKHSWLVQAVLSWATSALPEGHQ